MDSIIIDPGSVVETDFKRVMPLQQLQDLIVAYSNVLLNKLIWADIHHNLNKFFPEEMTKTRNTFIGDDKAGPTVSDEYVKLITVHIADARKKYDEMYVQTPAPTDVVMYKPGIYAAYGLPIVPKSISYLVISDPAPSSGHPAAIPADGPEQYQDPGIAVRRHSAFLYTQGSGFYLHGIKVEHRSQVSFFVSSCIIF